MILFIIVELPQGILAMVQAVHINFLNFEIVGDIFEVLTLLNSCLIFGLLCSMNSRIRAAFADICPQATKFQVKYSLRHRQHPAAATDPTTERLNKTEVISSIDCS
jgi:hypothetical protein